MKKIIFCLIATLMPGTVWADGNNFGSSSYLSQGVGARASGMGGAFVALADDATAGYWNPAGLAQMELYMYQLGTQYALLPNNIGYSYLAYAFQVPELGAFSIGWMNASLGDLEQRDEDANILGNLRSSENNFILSYGRKVYEWTKGLSLGANLKVLHQGLGDYYAVGHGLDLGAIWQPVLTWDHTVGINIQNIFQRLYWNTEAKTMDPALINIKLGLALKFLRSEEELYFNHLNTTLDLEFSEYRRFNYRLGAEYWVFKELGTRAGYNGQEITAGLSYRPEYYEVDYAFHYDLSELGLNQHRISVMLRFK